MINGCLNVLIFIRLDIIVSLFLLEILVFFGVSLFIHSSLILLGTPYDNVMYLLSCFISSVSCLSVLGSTPIVLFLCMTPVHLGSLTLTALF